MAYATLDQLKAQVSTAFADDDDLLQHYLDAAEEYVRGFLDHDPEADDPPSPVPDTVNHATLLIAAAWYQNRESVVNTSRGSLLPEEIPYGAHQLLNQLRGWVFG
ncbi:head-tail connector protein [Bradyrhizobium sp. LB11.1]|uniref:head-tail connector protein n=1 Tax=Bradyrhizobium sp. LB11.1 TaxID=3156326 RepID=UPI00339B0ADC